VVVIAKLQELLSCELGAIIRDDRVWDPKPVDYVGEELHGLLGFDLGDGPSLDPFGELVDCYQQVGDAPGRFLQRPDEVQSPHGERPCEWDGLQSVSCKMHLTGIELVTLASPHDFSGIGDCRGPVKTLPERITHEGARRRVVAANSSVDVSEQFPALENGDAALQDARGAVFV